MSIFSTQPLFLSKLISQNYNFWQVSFNQMVLKVQTEIYFIMFVEVTSFHQSQDKNLIITFFKNGPPYPTSQSFKFWHHLDFCSLKEGVSINWNSINSQLKKVFTGFGTSHYPLHFLFFDFRLCLCSGWINLFALIEFKILVYMH